MHDASISNELKETNLDSYIYLRIIMEQAIDICSIYPNDSYTHPELSACRKEKKKGAREKSYQRSTKKLKEEENLPSNLNREW